MAKKTFKLPNTDFANQVSVKSHKNYAKAIGKLPIEWRIMERHELVNKGDAIYMELSGIWTFWPNNGPHKQQSDQLFARKKG